MAEHLQQSFAELKSLNKALAQSESQLRQFLEAIPVGVSIHDATGKVTYFNRTAKRLLDIDLIPDAASEELAAVYQLYRQNQPYPTEELPALRSLRGETIFVDDLELRQDGKMIPFEIRSTPIFDEKGNIIYAINAFSDITERKQAEKRLADGNCTLEAQLAERTVELTRAHEQLQLEIVERKLLEEKLYSSTQQVRTIFESSSDIVLIIDEKKSLQIIPTKAIDWNVGGTNPLNSIVEQFFQEDTEEIWFAQVRQALETQQTVNFDYSLRINNQEVWLAAKISPLPNRSVVWVARNISDIYDELRLRQLAEDEARLLLSTTQSISRASDIESALTDILCLICQHIDWHFAAAWIPASDGTLEYSSGWCKSFSTFEEFRQASKTLTFAPNVGLPGRIWSSRQVEWISDIYCTTDSIFYRTQQAATVGLRAGFGVPIVDNNRVLAVLVFFKRSPSVEEPRVVELVNAIAAQLSSLIGRKLAEQALQMSQRRYQTLAEASPVCIFHTDESGNCNYVNQRWSEITGLSREEASELGWASTLHVDDRDRVFAEWYEAAAAREPFKSEYRFMRPDGKITWVIGQALPEIGNNGDVIGYVGTITDISDRKQVEQEIRQLSTALENAVEGISMLDTQGRYIAVNKAYASITGYQPEEMIGMEWPRTVHPDECEKMSAAYQEMLAVGKVEAESRGIRKDGSIFYKQVVMITAYDEQHNFIGHYCFMKNISDRKQAEKVLRESEQRYLAIIEDQTELIVRFLPDGTLTFVNEAYCRYFGFIREDIIGYLYEPLIIEEDREYVNRLVNSISLENPVVTIENRVIVAGEVRWTQWINRGLFDQQGGLIKVQSVGRDISDKKRAEQQLQWKEALLRSMTSASPLAFYVVDNRTDAILYFNHRFCQIWGIEHLEERMQQGVLTNNEIIPDCIPLLKDVVGFAESCKPLQSEENRIIVEDEIPFVDGRIIRRFSAQIRNTSDHYFGRLYIFEDITERKQSQAALQQAKETAETANCAKSQFLANMSHELRTPLNGILGYAQILQADKNCTPKQKKGVDIIHQCGTHLLTLINDILDLSKIEAGKIELYPEDFHLPSLLTSLSEIFQLKATQKSLTCTYFPLNQLPKVIHADQKRLRQVLMNLLSNAVKFTVRGSVTFKVEVLHRSNQSTINNEQITNNQQPTTNNKIRFQVEDTGIGIPSEQFEKIFLPFEQVGDISHRAEGTGLGLAITQKIIELMGCKIFVESTPGVGSKFWFDLDVPEISTSMKLITVKSTDTIIGYSGEKRKLLIVDDRWENCSVFINILESIGFELNEALNGQEGLEKAIEFKPDLIITDLVMPVMDGFEMTRQLRRLPEFKNTLIIATSASVSDVYQQESRESGCNDFLPKPVQVEELLNQIKDYLNLSWIYDQEGTGFTVELGTKESVAMPVPLRQSPSEMVIPSREELVALYEAVISGDITGVEQGIIQLKQLNPEYTAFASRVLELAEDFEYEEIAKLVDGYLSKESE